ncbi:GntR family transcriptional regulator [Coriobacteriales bacterium OH1046]|nr:GntR family transcriptional regulator [Coriobacteriales bacterium OH1046]
MLKYETVADDIRLRIANGEFAPSGQLPTTEEFCKQYDVSKITIKRAMDELVLRGLIARRRGSGTYVKGSTEKAGPERAGWNISSQMTGFSTEHANEKVESRVHDFSAVRPSGEIAEYLGMESDEFAYHVCRTRVADGAPQTVEYTYMPIKVIPDLREKHAEGSIYGYIEGDLGLKIGSAHRTIKAVLPEGDEAEWLDVTPTTPLLEVKQIGFLDDGIPFEYSISKHIPEYEFYSISTR